MHVMLKFKIMSAVHVYIVNINIISKLM